MRRPKGSKYHVTTAASDEAAAGLRVKCSDWRQVRRLQRQALDGDPAVVRLTDDDGAIDLALQLPDGQVVQLRARMTGRMLDDAGDMEGLIVHFDLDDGERAQLELVRERGSLMHSDAARMAELARHAGASAPPLPSFLEITAGPRHSGVQVRPHAEAADNDQDCANAEPTGERPSQRPTLPGDLIGGLADDRVHDK